MFAAAAVLTTIAVIWAPGSVAVRLLRLESRDAITRAAHELAAGLSFWPVLLLATTIAGVRWTATSARVFVACLLIAAVLVNRQRRPRRPNVITLSAIAVLGIVIFTRVRQVGGIVFPLWVDSVHHTMIVRLIVDHGALPSTYAPFIPESTFYYHWGFHAVVAFIAWVSGFSGPDALPRLLLVCGQVLNVFTFFAVYAGAAVLLRSKRAALLAATLATVVSLFPAYYVSWGRYPQLAGLLILPPCAVAFWRVGRHPRARHAVELAMLSAGLLLVHVRVAVLFAVLCAILAMLLAIQGRWRGLAVCGTAAVAALLVTSPWLVHVSRTPFARSIAAPPSDERFRWETPNGVPADLLWAPNNVPLFIAATGGLIGLTPLRELSAGGRIAAIVWWLTLATLLHGRTKRARRTRFDAWRFAVVVAWVGLVAAMINAGAAGLPRLTIVPNSAAITMLFLPLSIAAAHLIRWAADEVVVNRQLLPIATIALAAAGASTMLTIVNPQTVLATQADREALEWIRGHVAAGARFGVGVQPWIGRTYVGVDGGYWIPLAGERSSILPPGLYSWVLPRRQADSTMDLLDAWYAAQHRGAEQSVLRRAGVTHLYFGVKNATPLRRAAASSSWLRRVYSARGVDIYEATTSRHP